MIKGSFPISKVLVFEGNSYYVEKMKILDYFMIAMVKNVIKGSFPISKVLVFEGKAKTFEKGKEPLITFFTIAMVK